jgi:hypothetical protein
MPNIKFLGCSGELYIKVEIFDDRQTRNKAKKNVVIKYREFWLFCALKILKLEIGIILSVKFQAKIIWVLAIMHVKNIKIQIKNT